MSQSLHASSQSFSQEAQELINEIAFQKVLLGSIDDTVQNREAAEHEVREEIRALESQLRALRRGTTTKASQSASSQQSPFPQSFQATPSSRYSSKKPASSPEDVTTLGFIMDNSGNREQWPSSASSMPSTPNSADSLGDLSTPFRTNLPSRKRSYSKHLDGALYPVEDAKSRRNSPSPFLTGPTTPSSVMSSGYGYPVYGDGFFNLTFDEELEAFGHQLAIEQQKAQEARFRQTRLDEEFARNIQHANNTLQSTGSSSTQPDFSNNAFGRMSGMQQNSRPPPPTLSSGTMASSSSSQAGPSAHRTLPWATTSNTSNYHIKSEPYVKAESRSLASGIKPPNRPSVKVEVSSSRVMPGTFVDDSSAASDSDIEIIPPSAFHDNGRHPRPTGNQHAQQSFKRSPESIAAGQAALQRMGQTPAGDALQMALFGNGKQPDWATPASASNVQTSFAGTSEHVYPGSWYTPGPGLGYTMNNLPIYGGSNPGSSSAFADPLEDLISRNGTGKLAEISQHLGLGANMNGQLDYIINDPRKTNQEIKDLLENIRPDDELTPEDREGTPDGLVYPLYEHQKLALTWLKSMEEGKNKGGILADDMGLGKTISALALMLSRKSTNSNCKTTLIIGPVALVRQWEREIKKKIKPSHSLSTFMMHGKKLSWDDLKVYDVVLTTYGTLGAEWRRLEKYLEERKDREYDEAPMRKLFPLLGPRSYFYRVLLDEAQCIKNKLAQSSKAACHIKAQYRFCLTGTPMMNNVGELYSLIRFLQIRPYNDWTRFNSEFGMLTKDSRNNRYDLDKAMRRLQTVLKAILLRRVKTSLIDGKPIITLPPKTEEIQHVVFSEDEQAFYKALETKTQVQFNRYLKAGTVGKNYSNVLVLLLRLRQACCHPHLIQDFEELPAVGGASMDEMIELARGLAPDVVARLLAAEDAFECPVCYDAAPNPSILIPCGHDTCSECLTKIADSAVQQNVANGEERAAGRCPTCRGDLVIGKVIDYTTFKKVYKPEAVANDDDETTSENSDESDTESESESDDDGNSDGDLRDFIVPDDIDDIDEDSTEGEEGDDEAEAQKKNNGKGKAVSKSKSKSKTKPKDKKGKKKDKSVHVSIAMLKQEASKTKEGRKRYMRHLRKNWQPSAKVTKCVELLGQFREEGQKTIIFSQFVSLLDLLQVPINQNDWKCLRYDGGMSADERNDAVVKFTDSHDYNIMLISLKAGNAGLNLVAASRVIIVDPFWNPYIEMQAVDRAYRIGQQREVQVHRILIEGTVEDRIIDLQEKKRRLVESALDEGANKAVGRLDVQQLAFLFGVGA